MNKEVVTMVICPYCDEEWIIDDNLVCHKCEPKFKTDMVLSDLLACVEELSKVENMVPSRKKLLQDAIVGLQRINNKFQET